MIKVLGNDHERVKISDLNDVIYFKQEKIFSDDDYKKSRDLKRNIENGRLTILDATVKNVDIQDLPPSPIVRKDPNESQTTKLDFLIEYIKKLEEKLDNVKGGDTVVKQGVDANQVALLLEKIKQLEEKVESSKNASPVDVSELLKGLTEKVYSDKQLNGLSSKIDELLSRPSSGSGFKEEQGQIRPEDIYVPTITVEDANAHINLKVRTIDTSDSVKDASKALRELRNKNK